MPYLPGYTLVDAASNAIIDSAAVAIAEAAVPWQDIAALIVAAIVPTIWPSVEPGFDDVLTRLGAQIVGSSIGAKVVETDIAVDAIKADVETEPSALPSIYNSLSQLRTDSLWTLATVKGWIDAIQGGGGTTVQDVYNIINNYITEGGGGTPSDTWGYLLTDIDQVTGNHSRSAGNLLVELIRLAVNVIGKDGIGDERNPYFRLVVSNLDYLSFVYVGWAGSTRFSIPAVPDFTDAIPGDTVLSFLTRTQPAFDWTTTAPDGTTDSGSVWANVTGVGYDIWWKANFTPSVFPAVADTGGAPVWPGLANVTLGTPVEVTGDDEVAGPMDGLLMQVTTTPAGIGEYISGAAISYYQLGWLAFLSDNGQYDTFQWLQMNEASYCPKTLKQASACQIHLRSGATVLVTPWTLA